MQIEVIDEKIEFKVKHFKLNCYIQKYYVITVKYLKNVEVLHFTELT